MNVVQLRRRNRRGVRFHYCGYRQNRGEPGTRGLEERVVAMSTAVVFTLPRFDAGVAAALRSIVAATRSSGIPIVAVTYAGADPSAARALCVEIGVPLVEAGRHATFGAAANAGAREVAGERLVFVNGAEPMTLSSVDMLLDALDQTGAGVVGPRIRAEGGAKEICGLIVCSVPAAPRGFDFQVFSGVQARIECDALPDDCLVTTRQTFDELAGFAESFGSELEAIDYCLRARETGRRVLFEPGACVTRVADTAGQEDGRAEREGAFDDRWKTRVEYHENLWPELTGTIARSEFLHDEVVTERIAIPKVAILVHGDVPLPAFVAALSGSRMKPASAAYAAAPDAVRAARTMAELRGPDYVAFVRSDTVLAGDWLNELVNAIEGGPDAPEYTEIAIASIREHTRLPYEIIIIDNGSGPDTVSRLEKIPGIRVIYNSVNTGFAFGCNQGLAAAHGTHVVLLNNDVVVTDGWLEAVQQQHPTVGCSAPRTNECAGVQKLDVPYTSLDDMPAFAAQLAIEQQGRWLFRPRVIGFCLCLDRRVVDEIGGLDPGYGTGNFEDDDYCMRIRAAGYEIALCEDSFIHHFGNVTFRANNVDHGALLARNLARFLAHWDVKEVGEGRYDYWTPPKRGFQRERDYVPLQEAARVGPGWVAATGP
jgi:GT2 family glycosyltransferase